jgi:hypothetical protein
MVCGISNFVPILPLINTRQAPRIVRIQVLSRDTVSSTLKGQGVRLYQTIYARIAKTQHCLVISRLHDGVAQHCWKENRIPVPNWRIWKQRINQRYKEFSCVGERKDSRPRTRNVSIPDTPQSFDRKIQEKSFHDPRTLSKGRDAKSTLINSDLSTCISPFTIG